jgi:hypothetical protein
MLTSQINKMQKRRNKTAQRNITLNQGENQYLPAVKPAQKTEKPEGQSPLSFTAFLSKELFQKPDAFGIHLIQEDEITLRPYLLKDQK